MKRELVDDVGLVDAAFEFSAPRFCDLSRELAEELEYGDVGNTPGSDWFKRAHPLHEGSVKAELQPMLSPREWGQPLPPFDVVLSKASNPSLSARKKAQAASPFVRADTPNSRCMQTPQSGSARRVKVKAAVTEEQMDGKTCRILRFDEEGEEDAVPQSRLQCQLSKDLQPAEDEKHAREVELLLRKHNREVQARKKEVRQQKAHAQYGVRRRRNAFSSSSPSTAVKAQTTAAMGSVAVPIRLDDVDPGLKQMGEDPRLRQLLYEHNRRIRQAKRGFGFDNTEQASSTALARPHSRNNIGHLTTTDQESMGSAQPKNANCSGEDATKWTQKGKETRTRRRSASTRVYSSEPAVEEPPIQRKDRQGKQQQHSQQQQEEKQEPTPSPQQQEHRGAPTRSARHSSDDMNAHVRRLRKTSKRFAASGFDEEKENLVQDNLKSETKSRKRKTAKMGFTSSTAAAPLVRRRRTDAHSELAELLKQHNSRVRKLKGRNTK